MKGWKLILAIWSPVIILAVIYGIFYFFHYEHANNLKKKAESSYQNCSGPHYHWDSNGSESTGIPFVPNCESVGTIEHGFLGLPNYKAGSY